MDTSAFVHSACHMAIPRASMTVGALTGRSTRSILVFPLVMQSYIMQGAMRAVTEQSMHSTHSVIRPVLNCG